MWSWEWVPPTAGGVVVSPLPPTNWLQRSHQKKTSEGGMLKRLKCPSKGSKLASKNGHEMMALRK